MVQIDFTPDETVQDPDAPKKRYDVPPGCYNLIVIGSEKEEGYKSGAKGFKLVFEIKITDGEYADQKFKLYFNYEHSNPMTQKIARQTLTKFQKLVTGKIEPFKDTISLQFKPFRANLIVNEGKDGKFYNNIDYKNPPEISAMAKLAEKYAAVVEGDVETEGSDFDDSEIPF